MKVIGVLLFLVCALWFAPFTDFSVLAAQFGPANSQAPAVELPDFDNIVRLHADALAGVKSDAEAQALFATKVGPALGLKDILAALATKRLVKKPFTDSVYQHLTASSNRVIAELAVWRASLAAEQAAPDPSRWTALGQEVERQQTWIAQATSRRALEPLLSIVQVLAAFPPAEDRAGTTPPQFSDYSAQLDQQFPSLIGPSSWLSVAEAQGASAIRERLWSVPAVRNREPAEQEALANHYIATRLRPILIVHLTALASRVQAEASRQVSDQWLRLRMWKDNLREQRGLARLCGTWQWTIHNHQNHNEQKLSLVFPPPGSSGDNGPGPAEVVVLGDVVYLRWESGGHLQEDSLLFSKEGQRLEGTFINTAGGWGSITGKRTAGCSAP